MITPQETLQKSQAVLLIGYNTYNFTAYVDKYDNMFMFFRIGLSSGSVTTQYAYLWDNTNDTFINVGATISSSSQFDFGYVSELEAGHLYISDQYTATSGGSTNSPGLYKYDYTNNIFVKVSNYGRKYRVIRNTQTEAILGTDDYTNGSYNGYSVIYDKNNNTHTDAYQNFKKGKKFAGDMFACSSHIYHPSTDTLETTSGNYTTLMNDIGDEASYNYGLSLATGTKYLIYNK